MNDKALSVIIPVYNAQNYLEQCLKTVFDQKIKHTEVIIVDDGSTDQSLEIASQYQQEYNGVHIIRQRNQYAGVARNNGLKIAQGDYIYFLDADDYLLDSALKEIVQQAVITCPDIVAFEHCLYDELEQKTFEDELCYLNLSTRDRFNIVSLPENKFSFTNIAAWSKLYRRNFLIENRLEFEGRRSFNDVYFSWLSLAKAQSILPLNKAGVAYRVNTPKSLSSLGNQRKKDILGAFQAVETKLSQLDTWECIREDFKEEQLNKFASFVKSLLEESGEPSCKTMKFIQDIINYIEFSRPLYTHDEIEGFISGEAYQYILHTHDALS